MTIPTTFQTDVKGRNIIGETFGTLTVKKYSHSLKYSRHIIHTYMVQCVCGEMFCCSRSSLFVGRAVRCRKCAYQLTSGKHHYKWNGGKYVPLSFLTHIRNRLVRPSKTITCSLTVEELDALWERQEGKCAYTGMTLHMGKGWGGKQTASLDRIDSSLGYFIDNVQFVHKDVNVMKQALSHEYFVHLCCLIGARFDRQSSK